MNLKGIKANLTTVLQILLVVLTVFQPFTLVGIWNAISAYIIVEAFIEVGKLIKSKLRRKFNKES
jgi:uncharacterized protein YqfA (UPF0365 family)